MINLSNGRYWDLPWSLVSGCTPCSPGCERCWALGIERRFRKQVFVPGDPIGSFPVITHPERLSAPLKRKKPTVYALWNDLFHEAVPDEFIDKAFAAMALSPQHAFLVLTKRAERMFEWFSYDAHFRLREDRVSEACGDHFNLDPDADDPTEEWPLPNVWLIPTVCNQEEADRIVPIVLRTPAAHRGLSIEPMLGPIDLRKLNTRPFPPYGLQSENALQHPCRIGQVLLGGETGAGARPVRPDWVRSVRDQCAAAGVPFMFKQWGEHIGIDYIDNGRWPCSWRCSDDRFHREIRVSPAGGARAIKVGRKAAGRHLDGRTHDELAWRA